uniref:Uncharacterized protein n=1 Tax=viral metagenome TaxID=1070528 RepID=A0A6M3MEJ5_9ZZZZ
MAFSYTVTDSVNLGNKRRAYGTFTNASSSTGGDIVTGLASVDSFSLTHTASSVVTNAPVVNETIPLATGTVTIVTDANGCGLWEAIGN